MANVETEVSVKVSVDNSEAVKSVGQLKDQIKNATTNLNDLKAKFGETSKEVQQAEAELQKLNEQLQAPKVSDAPQNSVKLLKVQLREANTEFLKLAAEFGEFSKPAQEAAKNVADLKDRIGDAKALTDAFNPDRKFQAFSGALQSVAGGFAAVQGAQALFGSESKELEKTLVKVQGALALSQGINSILEAKDSFKILTSVVGQYSIVQKVVTAAQYIWNAALSANPIGAIVTAVTALIAGITALTSYLISSSNAAKEQTKSIEQSTKALEQQSKTLEKNSQEFEKSQNQKLALAKANGESTASIRALELKLIDEKIAFEKSAKATAYSTYEKEKNQLASLRAADADEELINKQIENVNKAVKEVDKQTQNIKNAYDERTAIVRRQEVEVAQERTNANNKEAEERKKAFEKAKADREAAHKERIENEKNANAELEKLREENSINELKTEREKAYKKLEIDKQNEIDRINALKISDELRDKLLNENSIKYQFEKTKLDEQFAKEDKEKQTEYLNKLNDLKEQIRIDGIKNQFDKEIELTKSNYEKQYAEIEKNEKLTAEQKLALKSQLQIKEQTELDAVEQKRSENILNKQLTELDEIIKSNEAKFSAKKQALDAEEELDKIAFDKKLINEEEYKNKLKKISEERIAIDIAEKEAKAQVTNEIVDLASNVVKFIAGLNEKSKGLAIASLIIEQAGAVAKIISNTTAANAKAVAASPLTAGQPFVAINTISAGLGIANAIKSTIKGIKDIKGANSGSSPSTNGVSSTTGSNAVAPPLTPQATSTLMNQNQINQLSSATTRAFVLESDVSGNQERIQRLNRAARIN